MSDLLDQVAELVAVASPSFAEGPLADLVEDRLAGSPWLQVTRVGDNLVARSAGTGPRVLLAGHLDTVPAAGNAEPRRDGDVLWGLGSADMKAGLAVMLQLAAEETPPASPLSLVFYVAEEVDRRHNGLLALEKARPDLLQADAVVLGEPTGAVVEAGCQGVLKLDVELGGRRAHTARPWTGTNAIHRLGPLLDRVAGWPERRPTLDGCTYREALQAVAVSGGIADNVVPDRATVRLSHRYAPDRDAARAGDSLRAWLEPVLDADADTLEVADAAPAAAPELTHPVLAAVVSASGAPPRAKLGWTDVAYFAERGVPALNYGPGDPEVAHRADERVERWQVEEVHRVLRRVLWGAADG